MPPFDFGAALIFDDQTELKIKQTQQLMSLLDRGILDHSAAWEQIFQNIGENPWLEQALEQAKEIGAKKYARVAVTEEKVESPPGKRKIVL